jgi:hypothetical protein
MSDWVACEQCKTIYEYDPVRGIAQCPYCRKVEDGSKAGSREAEVREPGAPRKAEAGDAREAPRAKRVES